MSTTVTTIYNRLYSGNYEPWGRRRDSWTGRWDAVWGRPEPEETLDALRFYKLKQQAESQRFSQLVDQCDQQLKRAHRRLEVLLPQTARSVKEIAAETGTERAQYRLEQYCRLNQLRPPNPISDKWYWRAFVFLAVLEAPLNVQAVQVFFGGSILSYASVLGTIIGFILMLLAHFTGEQISGLAFASNRPKFNWDGTPNDSRWHYPTFAYVLAAVLPIAVAGFVILLLGKLRQYSFDFWLQESSQTFQAMLQGSVQETIKASFDIPLGPEGVLIIIVNASLFAIGTYLSFRHYIADSALLDLHRNAVLENEIRAIALDLNRAFDELLEKRRERANFLMARLTVYRDANLSLRRRQAIAAFEQINAGIQAMVEEEIYRLAQLKSSFTNEFGEIFVRSER